MADEQRPQSQDPWVAPPLGSDGAGSGTYQDPFAQQSAGQVPQPGVAPYGQPYAAPGYSQPWGTSGLQYAPRSDKNWLGITSLILSIVGVSLGGVIFGHLGLGAVKRGEASNRGIALAGTIIGWVGLALGVIAVVLAISFSLVAASTSEGDWTVEASSEATTEGWWDEPTPESTDDWDADLAQPGDGVFGLEEANTYFLVYVNGALESEQCLAPSSTAGFDLDVVDCSGTHVGEVFLTAPLSELIVGDDVYGDATWTEMYDACTGAFDASAGGTGVDAMVDWWVFAASDDEELSGEDTFLCVASVDFSDMTGSVFDGTGGQSL